MYQAKDFSRLIGINGMSDALLNNHFTLYQGYVTNTNKLIELMKDKEIGTPEFAELHRRFGWEWNGMRLHELYFGNLTKGGVNLSERSLRTKIESTWGAYENWEKEFTGMASMRGIGWVILAHDKKEGKLFNVWVNEHDGGLLAGATPLLVMDVFEHAFMLDYGVKRIDYINAFMNSIDWHTVEERI
ncbi:Fe-Mn family superoxide dismutase [Candidatus Gracilibacteria bacterium]|nr:Fe-Mn family superoxide dismutase [Candidatus Gracilibacteria bacterium]MCF7898922.1 Fe-Mn family superoxide dismutase [Candidatus Paceibacterota bacterium]